MHFCCCVVVIVFFTLRSCMLNSCLTSWCSASYVSWQRGTPHVWPPHATAAAQLLLCAGHAAINRYFLPTGPPAANLQQRHLTAGWNRRTDRWTDARPCSAYTGTANKDMQHWAEKAADLATGAAVMPSSPGSELHTADHTHVSVTVTHPRRRSHTKLVVLELQPSHKAVYGLWKTWDNMYKLQKCS